MASTLLQTQLKARIPAGCTRHTRDMTFVTVTVANVLAPCVAVLYPETGKLCTPGAHRAFAFWPLRPLAGGCRRAVPGGRDVVKLDNPLKLLQTSDRHRG